MIERALFLARAEASAEELETFIAAGWIAASDAQGGFAEADLSRITLIRSLRVECGVNDEGIDVALRLLDQLHGARTALARMAELIRTLPEPLRSDVVRAMRGMPDARPGA
jgi:chaperone modulatory protein CbpM